MKKILLILISILTLSSETMAYEEANYEIINENNNYEIRKYFDRLVIETNTTQGNGFKKLFNYISGNNEQKKEIKISKIFFIFNYLNYLWLKLSTTIQNVVWMFTF